MDKPPAGVDRTFDQALTSAMERVLHQRSHGYRISRGLGGFVGLIALLLGMAIVLLGEIALVLWEVRQIQDLLRW